MFDKYPDVMNVDQLAEDLHIGRNSAYTLINSCEIGSKRIGRKIIVPKVCVIDYVQSTRSNII